MKNLSYIIVVLTYFLISTSKETNKTKITIYYEALCPDCTRWIANQLYPNYKILGKYMQLDFVPFGKAKHYIDSNGHWQFVCQHGPSECYGNAVQACVLHQNLGDSANLEFIGCYMVTQDISTCGKKAGVHLDKVSNCMKNFKKSPVYLATYGTRTNIEVQNLLFVPWILLNGQYYQSASNNLFGILCWLHHNPPECSRYKQKQKRIKLGRGY